MLPGLPAPSGAGSRGPRPGAEPRACGGPSARASFVRSAPAGRGPGGGASGAERFGEARSCPTPGERKFPFPPLSCDSSTLPPQPGRVRVSVKCVGCMNAAVMHLNLGGEKTFKAWFLPTFFLITEVFFFRKISSLGESKSYLNDTFSVPSKRVMVVYC